MCKKTRNVERAHFMKACPFTFSYKFWNERQQLQYYRAITCMCSRRCASCFSYCICYHAKHILSPRGKPCPIMKLCGACEVIYCLFGILRCRSKTTRKCNLTQHWLLITRGQKDLHYVLMYISIFMIMVFLCISLPRRYPQWIHIESESTSFVLQPCRTHYESLRQHSPMLSPLCSRFDIPTNGFISCHQIRPIKSRWLVGIAFLIIKRCEDCSTHSVTRWQLQITSCHDSCDNLYKNVKEKKNMSVTFHTESDREKCPSSECEYFVGLF